MAGGGRLGIGVQGKGTAAHRFICVPIASFPQCVLYEVNSIELRV